LPKIGGHLGPNLGVVELTIALPPRFQHAQRQVHLGREPSELCSQTAHRSEKTAFHTIRTTGGLNGFALRTESEHDCYGAAHAGTRLSAALGMAVAGHARE